MTTQSNSLALEDLMNRGPGRVQPMGLQRVGQDSVMKQQQMSF